MQRKLDEFRRLLEIMDRLRVECPWDRKQTNETLRYLTIEEMYELGDAVLEKNDREIMKELGDIMLHIVFYAKIGSEKGAFDMGDVLHNINEKLIRRHPHVFGEVSVADDEEVKANWEKIKMGEGRKSVLEGVPKGLPAIVKAFRMQEKVKGVGFEWEKTEQVWEKVQEELSELNEEVKTNAPIEKVEDEFIANLRLNSLLWAVLVNYVLLLFMFLFIYGLAFLNIMVYNMFTILFLFIGKFNIALYRNSKSGPNEE